MPGLMEKKKAERKSRIQIAAVDLFGTIGYANTTMEKIAEKAVLGVGTLYNYYKSKGDILLSIISERAEGLKQDFDSAIKNHSSDIILSVNSVFDIYFKSFSTYNRVIWREFVANALSQNTSLIDFISRIDAMFIDNLAKLLLSLKSEGTIKDSTDIEKVVQTLYSLIIFHILRYISDENLSMEDLRKSLDDQLGVVIEGLN